MNTISLPFGTPLRLPTSGGRSTLRDWGLTGAALSTAYTSPSMGLDGLDSETSITVESGLTYSLDGGAFTGDAGTRGTAKKIRFRLTSSASYETLVSLDATIGAETYTMSVTTRAATPSSPYWLDVDGNQIQDVNGNPIEVI